MKRSPRREFAAFAAHVLGLWAVAVAQALFDVLGRGPEFFVAHHAGPIEILTFVFGLVIVIPVLLTAAAWLGGRVGQRATVLALCSIVAMQLAALTCPGERLPGRASARATV